MSNPFDDLGSGGMFDGLDDPTPPAFGSDLLPGVIRRGHHLRQQRRLAYSIGSACAAVLVAGAGIGLTGGSNGDATPVQPLSPSPSASHSKKPHHHHPASPGTTVGGAHGGGQGAGGKHPQSPCVTPTPTPTDPASSSASPTPIDTLEPTPLTTDSSTPDSESTPSPNPTPVDTGCPSPSATGSSGPTESPTPTPTYSLPPLLSDAAHPWDGIVTGIL